MCIMQTKQAETIKMIENLDINPLLFFFLIFSPPLDMLTWPPQAAAAFTKLLQFQIHSLQFLSSKYGCEFCLRYVCLCGKFCELFLTVAQELGLLPCWQILQCFLLFSLFITFNHLPISFMETFEQVKYHSHVCQ